MKPQDQQPTTGSSNSSTGNSWQFLVLVSIIAIGVLALIAKALGLF